MEKNTMSIYAWIIVALMCMGVLMSFATPFGKYTMNEVTAIAEELVDKAFDDGTENALETPNLAIDGAVLTVTPVNGATTYDVYNGNAYLISLTENMTVNLNDYIVVGGMHVIKVVAKNDTEISDVATIGYRLEETICTHQTESLFIYEGITGEFHSVTCGRCGTKLVSLVEHYDYDTNGICDDCDTIIVAE